MRAYASRSTRSYPHSPSYRWDVDGTERKECLPGFHKGRDARTVLGVVECWTSSSLTAEVPTSLPSQWLSLVLRSGRKFLPCRSLIPKTRSTFYYNASARPRQYFKNPTEQIKTADFASTQVSMRAAYLLSFLIWGGHTDPMMITEA